MGTFVKLFRDSESIIPESRKEEFIERIEKIYQAGGMMEVEDVVLYRQRLTLIRKPKMDDDGMNFYYNYFEDDCWENAGFDRNNCYVWSNKVGWRQFLMTVAAAYILEELYTEGVSATMINGHLVTSWKYVGWINYLFDEKFHIKNYDPWKLFETLHDKDKEKLENISDFHFGEERYAFIGECEIHSVMYGTQKALELFGARDIEELERFILYNLKRVVDTLIDFEKIEKSSKDMQLRKLMDMIRVYYEDSSRNAEILESLDKNLKSILQCVSISDAPAFVVQAISEIYHKDFWNLWAEVRDVARRKYAALYGNEGYYVLPISTMNFFELSPDDMIPYWEENCDFEFSEELWNWFGILKHKFDIVMNTDFIIENPLRYMVHLMKEADENYCSIFTFSDFFEEALENLRDKRYQSLWKLYDDLIHDPKLKKAADVIKDFRGRNNKARVTLRRYNALLANRPLRCKVFGF